MPWVLEKAKAVRDGGEWGISSQQLFYGPLGLHGLVFPAHGFQPALGQARCSEEAPVPPALLPPPAVPTAFWGGLMGQAWSHPPCVGFGDLTLPTPMPLGVISNNCHILPPK